MSIVTALLVIDATMTEGRILRSVNAEMRKQSGAIKSESDRLFKKIGG